MRFLGQHELAGPRQRIERAFGQRGKLELAVAVGEEREHEHRQPFRGGFVERAQNAGLVLVTGMTLQHHLRFLAAVAAEMGMKQIDHGPEVPAFLDVDLEQVAEVVQGRRGLAQQALLLDGRGFRVALGDDQPAQGRSVFAGHVLPDRFTLMIAESDLAVRHRLVQENAPAVFGHFDVVEMGPAIGTDIDRGSKIDVVTLCAFGTQFVPPAQIVGKPRFQRPLKPPVFAEIDVVRNAFVVIDGRHDLVLCCVVAMGGRRG